MKLYLSVVTIKTILLLVVDNLLKKFGVCTLSWFNASPQKVYGILWILQIVGLKKPLSISRHNGNVYVKFATGLSPNIWIFSERKECEFFSVCVCVCLYPECSRLEDSTTLSRCSAPQLRRNESFSCSLDSVDT